MRTVAQLVATLALAFLLNACSVCSLWPSAWGSCSLSCKQAAEGVLRDDLFALRSLINQYALERQRRPQNLNDLVAAHYLKSIPIDPMTRRSDTWLLKFSTDPKSPGIIDVHSGSREEGGDWVPYDEW